MRIPDALDLWEAYDSEKERRLAKRPLCSICDNHIQDEDAYLINGDFVCQDCLDRDFKICVEDYIDEF